MLPSPLARTPAAVSVVEVGQVLEGRPTVGLEEALVGVPGVFAQGGQNFAQDVRLSVSGFGARSAFGIRGVTLLVDGFPETLPDGQAQVDTLDMAAMGRLEVLRGLASSAWGNAAGGELTFRPPGGLLLGLQALTAGGRFVDDANSFQEPSVLVLSARAAWEVALGRWSLSPFLGAHNLTSAADNDSVRINATGGRFFEPAAPFTLWGGLGVSWRAEPG